MARPQHVCFYAHRRPRAIVSSYAVLIVMIVLLLVAAIAEVRLIHRGRSSYRWPTAKGKVIDLEVVGIQRGKTGSSSFRPTIRYRYQVSGREYQGDRIRVTFAPVVRVSDEAATLHEASSVLDGYYPGAPVAVYYDPRDPKYSLLRPGVSSTLYLLCFGTIATLAMLLGIWAFLVPRA